MFSFVKKAKAKAESWGEGGSTRRKVDTAVAVVGAILAGKTTAQTAVAAISPELNAQIHEITKDSKLANILAHATLSATEFYAAGLDPMAGALAGAAGEGSAMLLAEKVFNKKPADLTAGEKELLKVASQLAGAVVGGISGDSLATATEGAETAKRAVENNYLSILSDNRKHWLKKQLEREDLSSVQREKYEREFIYLEQDDHTSDILVKKALNNPSDMTEKDWELYNNYITRYYLESIGASENPQTIQENLTNILANKSIKGYSYPYATEDRYSKYLPSRWNILGIEKFSDENFYSSINSKYKNQKVYEESFNGRVAKSTAEALGYASTAMPLGSIYANIPKLIDKPILIAGGFSAGAELTQQMIENKGDINKVDTTKVTISTITGITTKNMGTMGIGVTNAGVEALDALRTGKDPIYEGVLSGISAAIGSKAGSIVEGKLDKKFNPKWKEYTFEEKYIPYPIQSSPKRNHTPSMIGNSVDSIVSPVLKSEINEIYEGEKNGKK